VAAHRSRALGLRSPRFEIGSRLGTVAMIDIPLFPLGTVLFPGSRLRLRVFEQRYLDLVADCSRRGCGFGVCLILEGAEVGAPAVPAAIGTLAHITDFGTTGDGLLGIVVAGDERFHVRSTRVRDNGLVHGEVEPLASEPLVEVPPDFGLLAQLLERLIDHSGLPHADAERARYDDASWVGFRLAEALPLAMSERQFLLQMTDPLERLAQLMHYLPRFQRA
jgi:Lon protease-like protein